MMSDPYRFRLQSGSAVSFYPVRQELLLHGNDGAAKVLSLGYAEARLLGLLLAEPGVIRSRDEILRYAWEDRVVAPGNLSQAIFALRNLIEDGRNHEILQTVPRRGYRFNAEYVLDDTLPELPETISPSPDTAGPTSTSANATTAVTGNAAPRGLAAHARRTMAWTLFYLGLASLLGWIVYHRAEIASSLTRDVHVASWRKDGIAWHVVDGDAAGAQRIRNDLAATIDAMPATARGSIWVNRMFRMYDFSCIRTDESATEMVVSEHVVKQGRLPGLLASCLEKTP